MRRRLYLFALLIVQFALVFKLTPPLALALRVDLAPGLAPTGWPAMLQLVATAAAVVGTSLALVFPIVALARHRRGGPRRFQGLPEWAIALSMLGAAALAAGYVALALVPILPVESRMTVVLVARTVVVGGLAIGIAGVLCAELLRRSIASIRTSAAASRRRAGRVEVTHPPDLRTHPA